MKRPSKNGEYFLMDSTAVISRSENASFLELAYNSKGIHLLRINEMILYSATRTLPTFISIPYESIGDFSAMSGTIDMVCVERRIIVANNCFFSTDNIMALKKTISAISYR